MMIYGSQRAESIGTKSGHIHIQTPIFVAVLFI